jgi:hypothetical protein
LAKPHFFIEYLLVLIVKAFIFLPYRGVKKSLIKKSLYI